MLPKVQNTNLMNLYSTGAKRNNVLTTSRWTATSTITGSSGNLSEVISVENLSSLLTSLESSEDETIVIIDSVQAHFELAQKADQFIMIPFLLFSENTVSLATTEAVTSDPGVLLDAAVAGGFAFKTGEAHVSHGVRDNGAAYHVVNSFSVDLTEECRKWMKKFHQAVVDQEDMPHIEVGIMTITADNGVSVTYNGFTTVISHFETAQISNVINI